jgi:hypothetical protein
MGRSVIIRAMTEAVRTSETSVYFSETTQRYIPESCHPHMKDYCLLFVHLQNKRFQDS